MFYFVTISTYAAYCKHCGKEATEKQLVNYACPRLKNKMKHEIFEGRKKINIIVEYAVETLIQLDH